LSLKAVTFNVDCETGLARLKHKLSSVKEAMAQEDGVLNLN